MLCNLIPHFTSSVITEIIKTNYNYTNIHDVDLNIVNIVIQVRNKICLINIEKTHLEGSAMQAVPSGNTTLS